MRRWEDLGCRVKGDKREGRKIGRNDSETWGQGDEEKMGRREGEKF